MQAFGLEREKIYTAKEILEKITTWQVEHKIPSPRQDYVKRYNR